MEAIKNFVTPGKTNHTETIDDTTTGHSSGLAGEGSHFEKTNDATGTGHTGLVGEHTTTGTNTAGPHNTDILNKADPTVDSDLSGSRTAAISGPTSSQTGPHSSETANKLDPNVPTDHHHSSAGKDAALGAGAVGIASHEHKHEADKEVKHEKGHKGLFSFLHRDKSKKYTPEEEAEFERQEREHNSITNKPLATAPSTRRTSDPNAMPWQRDTVVSEPLKSHSAAPVDSKHPSTVGTSSIPESEVVGNTHHAGHATGTNGNLTSGQVNPASEQSGLNGTHEQSDLAGDHSTTGHSANHENSTTHDGPKKGYELPPKERTDSVIVGSSPAPAGSAKSDPHLHHVRE